MANFTVAVPEDVGSDTPLPDLNVVVVDADVSRNAEYDLVIEDVSANSEGVFDVYPRRAVGRTPVIVRVANPDRLDYESPEGSRFVFRVNAVQGAVLFPARVADFRFTEMDFHRSRGVVDGDDQCPGDRLQRQRARLRPGGLRVRSGRGRGAGHPSW